MSPGTALVLVLVEQEELVIVIASIIQNLGVYVPVALRKVKSTYVETKDQEIF